MLIYILLAIWLAPVLPLSIILTVSLIRHDYGDKYGEEGSPALMGLLAAITWPLWVAGAVLATPVILLEKLARRLA